MLVNPPNRADIAEGNPAPILIKLSKESLPGNQQMAAPALQQLRQLQRTLYDQAYSEAISIVGEQSRNLILYSTQFENSLPDHFSSTTLTAILETLRKKQYVLFGDFHTLRQCQRGFLRLLRSYRERLKDNKVIIALEMFKARDQEYVNEYIAGVISEHELLDAINYRNDWGFPWQNFKMIIDFARENQLQVIGINTDKGGQDTLKSRDQFAASTLAATGRKFPDHKIFCLIGEHHLADRHLPTSLWTELQNRDQDARIMRIVSNVDRYYFDLPAKRGVPSTEYLKLKKDFYCIINTPPWMKWQSFSIWEEMRHAGTTTYSNSDSDDNELDFYNEETFDIDFQILRFCKNICAFLNINALESDLETFDVCFSRDSDFFSEITNHEDVNPGETNRIIERASIDGVFFLSDTQTILLSHISINNIAEAAGQFIHSTLTRFTDIGVNEVDSFNRRLIKAATGMIGSKVLNPRRKCNGVSQARQFLLRHKGRSLTGRAAIRRTAAESILKYDEWMQKKLDQESTRTPRMPRSVFERDNETDYEVSRYLGQWLGLELYTQVIQNHIPASEIEKILFGNLDNEKSVWEAVKKLYRYTLK